MISEIEKVCEDYSGDGIQISLHSYNEQAIPFSETELLVAHLKTSIQFQKFSNFPFNVYSVITLLKITGQTAMIQTHVTIPGGDSLQDEHFVTRTSGTVS